jgi:putative transcriptional regulator
MSAIRIVLLVVALLHGGAGLAASPAVPVDGPVPSLAGQLLVATPELDDPNFRRTIVFMVRHDEGGALGVVINRVLGAAPLGELLRGYGIQEGADSESQIRVHYGGPVQLEHGFVLHSPDYRQDQALVVDDLAAFTDSPDALRDIALGRGPRRSLFAFGYAGWGANQLESEIARGSWLTIEADEALLYDEAADADAKWRLAVARGTGVDL